MGNVFLDIGSSLIKITDRVLKFDVKIWIYLMIAIRLIYIVTVADTEIKLVGDAVQYYDISQNLLSGNGFSLDGETPSVRRAPAYPIFLATVFSLFPDNLIAVYLFQLVLDILTFLMVNKIVRLLWQNSRIEAYFNILFATYLPLAIYVGSILSENLFTFTFSAFIFYSIKYFKEGKLLNALLVGMTLAAASLVRPVPLLFLFIVIPLVFLLRCEIKTKLIESALILAGFIILISPWMVRNYLRFNVFLPVTVSAGVALYDGTHPGYDGTTRARQSAFDLGIISVKDSEIEKDRKLLEFAVNRLKHQSIFTTLKLFTYQITRTWFNIPFPKTSVKTYLLILWHLFFMFTALNGLKGLDCFDPVILFLALIPVYFTFIYMPFPSYVRYIIPVIPALLVFSARGVDLLLLKYSIFKKSDVEKLKS